MPLHTLRLYFIRHATPDWSRTDIPYMTPPGPPLTPKGEQEAQTLGAFLKEQKVVKLYHSPFERTTQTARIAAGIQGIPCLVEPRLVEWHGKVEAAELVRRRMLSMFQEARRESEGIGPIGLVTHGGPVAVLLRELGLADETLAAFQRQFDHANPLPPAGAWEAAWDAERDAWALELKFIPSV
ncbi:MAG: histidine phosphatase family protein [Chloroflexota bacterium]